MKYNTYFITTYESGEGIYIYTHKNYDLNPTDIYFCEKCETCNILFIKYVNVNLHKTCSKTLYDNIKNIKIKKIL